MRIERGGASRPQLPSSSRTARIASARCRTGIYGDISFLFGTHDFFFSLFLAALPAGIECRLNGQVQLACPGPCGRAQLFQTAPLVADGGTASVIVAHPNGLVASGRIKVECSERRLPVRQ